MVQPQTPAGRSAIRLACGRAARTASLSVLRLPWRSEHRYSLRCLALILVRLRYRRRARVEQGRPTRSVCSPCGLWIALAALHAARRARVLQNHGRHHRAAQGQAPALEADSGGNKDRKKLEVALELCVALAALDMKRGVVQYADLAIDLDGDCVPAHCFRAEALQAMAQQRPSSKAAAKAAKACAKGLGRVRPLRRARGARANRARLERVCGAPAAAASEKASTKSRAQPPQKLENAVVDLSSEDKPRKVAVTTADVRNAGGAPLRQSDWNKKDTSVSGAERAPSTYRIDGVTSRHLHAIDAYATQVGGARRDERGPWNASPSC